MKFFKDDKMVLEVKSADKPMKGLRVIDLAQININGVSVVAFLTSQGVSFRLQNRWYRGSLKGIRELFKAENHGKINLTTNAKFELDTPQRIQEFMTLIEDDWIVLEDKSLFFVKAADIGIDWSTKTSIEPRQGFKAEFQKKHNATQEQTKAFVLDRYAIQKLNNE